MSVFKVVGKIVRVLEGGAEREVWIKRFFRADTENEAKALVTVQGINDAQVTYFCENHSADLGNIKAYSADNGLGVASGW